ncbi:MAG: hypothetical protein ACLUFI_05085 [Oscillospiraceae bacterium]
MAFDTISKIAYFPATSGGDVITSSTASVSSIMLIEEPQDATYKLNAAVGTLTVKASIIGTGKTLKTFTWYDNNNKVVDTQTVTNSASTYTSTLNLADFVTSAGTYGFKCVITGGTDTCDRDNRDPHGHHHHRRRLQCEDHAERVQRKAGRYGHAECSPAAV